MSNFVLTLPLNTEIYAVMQDLSNDLKFIFIGNYRINKDSILHISEWCKQGAKREYW